MPASYQVLAPEPVHTHVAINYQLPAGQRMIGGELVKHGAIQTLITSSELRDLIRGDAEKYQKLTLIESFIDVFETFFHFIGESFGFPEPTSKVRALIADTICLEETSEDLNYHEKVDVAVQNFNHLRLMIGPSNEYRFNVQAQANMSVFRINNIVVLAIYNRSETIRAFPDDSEIREADI